MNQKLRFGVLLLSLAIPATACEASPTNAELSELRRPAVKTAVDSVTNNQRPINERFRDLDAYLAYLEKVHAPIDRAWYREIRPGIFELQPGNFRPLDGDKQKRIFTREELERKFGFRR